ncbi:MAG TPA: PAS domain S-box protein [Gemmatimonadales bacterium]|nr:PAS domain S-box protein [Gemmatimonadales bacterium]
MRDLTEQRSAETALRRWATVFRAVSEAVIISDQDGKLVDANPSSETLLGRRRADMVGRPIGDWHAAAAATSEEIRSAAARTGHWSGPLRFLRPDGSVRVTDSTIVPLFDSEGRLNGYAGVNRDVTDQERVAESARSMHERLEAVITSTPLAMYMLDPGLVVQAWNPAAERIFGWTAAEAVGRVLPTLGPGDIAEARALMGRVEAGEALSGVELTRHRKDGSPVSISLSSAPLRDASGTFVGLSSIAEDVTEAKRLEAQLRQAQRMESVGRLSGGIAHDFNNLLTAILGSAELLRSTLPEGSPELEEVNEIEKASRRAADLTRQLLAFSRQQMLAPAVVDPNDLVIELKRMLGRVVGEDIHFETRLRPDIGKVRADPGQLGQVIMNLVVNARDAMPQGGMLTIATAVTTLDQSYVERHPGSAAGEFVVISVTDTGSGIPAGVLPHIFEPFYTTKAPGVGTGLGLSTAYGIVKQSGGYIWVYSEMGKGSTFKVYLPSWTGGGEVGHQPRHTPAPTDLRGTETILAVEDEPGIRRLVARTLSEHGYKVITASDALEAVTKLAEMQGELDLLATDVVMPGMGGRELADHVRSTHPGTKVLFLSGYTEDAIIRHGIHTPTQAFLEKPFTPAELLRKVRGVLDQRGG